MPFPRPRSTRARTSFLTVAAIGIVAAVAVPGAPRPPRRDVANAPPATRAPGTHQPHHRHHPTWHPPSHVTQSPVTRRTRPPDPHATTTLPRTPPTTTATTTTTVAPPGPAVNVSSTTGDYRTWPDWPTWQAIGRCEQGLRSGEPDPWGDGIGWAGTPRGGTPGSMYPGGLGILTTSWSQYRTAAGVTTTNGALATPADQIRVARAIRNAVGLNGWGCASRL